MRTFETYGALTDAIMFEIADALPGSRFGVSERSISRYVSVDVYDDEDEFVEERRIRISDHEATASCGGGIVYEIDVRKLVIEEINDECGIFSHIEVTNDFEIPEMVAAAVKALG